MKHKLTILLLFLTTIGYAQNDRQDKYDRHYRQLVKDFYRQLFKESVTVKELDEIWQFGEYENSELKKKQSVSDTEQSELMKSVKNKYFDELTNKLTIKEIEKVIDMSELSTDGYEFGIILELALSKKYSVYFDLDSDIPGKIERIYLKDAIEIGSKENHYPKEQLFRPGTINDTDGYTNLREKPDSKSKIVGRLKTNELFFYSPIGDSDWYPVKKEETSKILGYIHKTRITKYSNLPKLVKRKVDKIRGGC
jgi:hypothetical protein